MNFDLISAFFSLVPTGASRRRRAATARRGGDWALAVELSRQEILRRPKHAPAYVRYANDLRKVGRLDEADQAYKTALSFRVSYPYAELTYASFLITLGKKNEARNVLDRSLNRSPSNVEVRKKLSAVGGGNLKSSQHSTYLSSIEANQRFQSAIRELIDVSHNDCLGVDRTQSNTKIPILVTNIAVEDYINNIFIDARDFDESSVRITVSCLSAIDDAIFKIHILCNNSISNHSVTTISRMTYFYENIHDLLLEIRGKDVLVVECGSYLSKDEFLIACFSRIELPDHVVVFDYDHFELDWREGPSRCSPIVHSSGTIFNNKYAPVCAVVPNFFIEKIFDISSVSNISHMPCIVGSRSKLKMTTNNNFSLIDYSVFDAKISISVIIPTRGCVDMVDNFIGSLIRNKSNKNDVSFVIIDNKSDELDRKRLRSLQRKYLNISIIDADFSFNWSAVNNLGASAAKSDILLFANNDMEMLSSGWDTKLCSLLRDERVGVVGAKLLYPNFTVQHAGIILGAGDGRPVHDGHFALRSDCGPMDRWMCTREAAAVTGAFMAVRSDFYRTLGGFDAKFAIAYNDIDFCLRVREAGKRVILCADLELIHFESATRGENDTPAKRRWDDLELTDLYARWGDAMLKDPSVSPQWFGSRDNPFEAIRPVSLTVAADWLRLNGSGNPWRVHRRGKGVSAGR